MTTTDAQGATSIILYLACLSAVVAVGMVVGGSLMCIVADAFDALAAWVWRMIRDRF